MFDKTGLLEILAMRIFNISDGTGADLGRFCVSTTVFTVDTSTLLDELFDSDGLPGFFVTFESPDNDMLLLECQAAVVDSHDKVGVITHPDTPAMGNIYT
jgi:hypothetical protein